MAVTEVRVITLATAERAVLQVTERNADGTEQTSEYVSTADEVHELASLCASRAGISYGTYTDGKCVAVTVPFDTAYVAPTQTVYLVLHPVYETYAAYLTKAEAERARAQECKDAREALREAPSATQYEKDNARAYYVSQTDVQALGVPVNVRLQGKDSVLEWLNA